MAHPALRMLYRGMEAFLLFVILLCLALWFLACWSNQNPSPNEHLIQWLQGCPEGDLRFVCNENGTSDYPSYYHMYGQIDLQKSDLEVAVDAYRSGSITLTIGPGGMNPTSMTPAQKSEIEGLIQVMPARRMSWIWKSYDFGHNIYFAGWKDHEMQIYVYPKDDLPDGVVALLKLFTPNVLAAIKGS